ncbi:sensor histidine kinase [Sandaracinobacteroides saxicola]|uniref:histidine kinase n=1 Tax=Sandaracinobacteroides saxicola TaxID=2759707 RepID=A0A7G5ILG1_9SPHN|nr:sensor histidine kinase KdpD [Sandaracinobacteroides saxicola]QMW24203.1 sensor histidine kinase KdpD [Sandaracinobacteroides saxicola]
MTDQRPSPDNLLKAAKREGRGRLKIILGAAPGVGKTFEMLREGADALKAGRDVVVGVAETHGRAETEALLAPFEILPRHMVAHQGHSLAEFDLDGMLARRPQLALIDELAHSNVTGSRHPKRWQDIEELRDAGIDVLTTLNVQHIESLNDVVASFTHIRVRETVPDALLEDADLELVDLPPDELIARLKAGKVYVPGEAARALDNFFTKANLSALRELALRRAAMIVDRALIDHVDTTGAAGTWKGGERLVVAIGDQPGDEILVRTAKRLADGLRASWSALVVETPRTATLGAEARARMAATLDLAASLGAAITTVPAASVDVGLRQQLGAMRATTLVIGKQRRSWWFELRHGSVVDRLVRDLAGVAVHVVPIAEPAGSRGSATRRPIPFGGIAAGLVLVALTTAAAVGLGRVMGSNAVDLLFLLPIIVTATLFGLRPSLVASLAAALAYNFFFLPPLYTFTIANPQNIITLFVLVVVSVVASQLAGRVRREANIGARTATENAALATFGQRLAAVSDEAATAAVICEEIAALFDANTVFLVMRQGRHEAVAGAPDLPVLSPIDSAAIDWAFARGEASGRATGTLTGSEWQFHPLATSLGVLAVLGIARDAGDAVPPERRVLFTTMLGQAALAQERLKLEAEARDVSVLRQRDELRTTLVASMGHDLKTPLTAVVATADALAARHGDCEDSRLLRSESRRLARLFDNLVEMTRLDAGAVRVRPEPLDLTDAVGSAVGELTVELAAHRLVIEVPVDLPLVAADPRLLHHVLVNLLINAAKFAPAGTAIFVRAAAGDGVELRIEDEGPGLPPGQREHLFERFTRIEGDDRSGGSGLGLAIVKGFAEAMGLAVLATDRAGGGACFAIAWPPALLHPVPSA